MRELVDVSCAGSVYMCVGVCITDSYSIAKLCTCACCEGGGSGNNRHSRVETDSGPQSSYSTPSQPTYVH